MRYERITLTDKVVLKQNAGYYYDVFYNQIGLNGMLVKDIRPIERGVFELIMVEPNGKMIVGPVQESVIGQMLEDFAEAFIRKSYVRKHLGNGLDGIVERLKKRNKNTELEESMICLLESLTEEFKFSIDK